MDAWRRFASGLVVLVGLVPVPVWAQPCSGGT